jgi:hypothetical protein
MSLAHGDVTLAEAAIQSEVVTTVGVAKSHWLALLQSAACLLPFAITGALYESLRGVFRHIGAVHVADLAALEARLFSVATAQGPRPLSELIARQTSVGLDLWCGTTYALFLIESVAVTLYLLFRSRAKALELSLGFLLINLLGWLIWVCYPAAPPWYFDAYGGQSAPLDVVSSAAGLLRFSACPWLRRSTPRAPMCSAPCLRCTSHTRRSLPASCLRSGLGCAWPPGASH